jgi:hypothetical protein
MSSRLDGSPKQWAGAMPFATERDASARTPSRAMPATSAAAILS